MAALEALTSILLSRLLQCCSRRGGTSHEHRAHSDMVTQSVHENALVFGNEIFVTNVGAMLHCESHILQPEITCS